MTRSTSARALRLTSKIVLVVVASSFLIGCETICPNEKQYSREQQRQIAAELRRAGPALRGAMVDYGDLRDKVRACRGERVP